MLFIVVFRQGFIVASYVYDVRDPISTGSLRPGSAYFQFYSRTIYSVFRPHTAVIFSTVEPLMVPMFQTYILSAMKVICYQLLHRGKIPLTTALYACFLLGRSIGLYYDSEDCVCQRRTTCIMNGYQSLTDAFSNCSYENLQNDLRNGLNLYVSD